MTSVDVPELDGAIRVLLVCSQPKLTSSSIYCLNGMGAKIIAAGDDWMDFLKFSRFCDGFEHCAVLAAEPTGLVRRVNELARKHEIDIVVPGDNDGQIALSAIQDQIEPAVFPLPSSEALAHLNDKKWFYELCCEVGVPVPQSLFVMDKHELDPEVLGAQFGYPLIVKPTGEGGSDGLVIARSAEDLRQRVLTNRNYQFRPLVVQPFIKGRDVGFNVFAVNGAPMVVSAQMRDHDAVVFFDNEALIEHGKRFVSAAKLNGIANLDARIAPDGRITFFECNPRAWSSVCHSAWCGANYLEAGINFSLGRPQRERTSVAGRSVTSPARLIKEVATFKRKVWKLSQSERRALKQGLSDPVLLLRRYLENRRVKGAARSLATQDLGVMTGEFPARE